MSRAPERIWAQDIGDCWWFAAVKGNSTVEYVRADIALASLDTVNDPVDPPWAVGAKAIAREKCASVYDIKLSGARDENSSKKT